MNYDRIRVADNCCWALDLIMGKPDMKQPICKTCKQPISFGDLTCKPCHQAEQMAKPHKAAWILTNLASGNASLSRNGEEVVSDVPYHKALMLFRELHAEDLLRTMPWHPSYDPLAAEPTYEEKW